MRTRSSAPFLQPLPRLVDACVARRWVVIGATLAIFVAAMVGFGLVQQQFFPNSTRLELLVDLRLPEGASLRATQAEVEKLEAILARSRASPTTWPTWAPAARASTCPSTSSCRRPTLPSSWC
jgi:multidrug efflux pump subunit AcrB